MKTMVENKLKRALECVWHGIECIGDECHYFESDTDCTQLIAMDTLELLSHKDTEISKLKKSNRNWRRKVQRLRNTIKEMVGK